jgi:hypothetical protein
MAGRYHSIWKQLKETGTCTIASPVPLHKRIIKAVVMCKYRDQGFKLLGLTERKRHVIQYKVAGAKITFTLITEVVMTEISVQEL